ncbi:hypothetical protein Bca101_101835 [Brassica carinata]
MEFFEAFGCIWSSKEVFKAINGRAAHQSDAVKSLAPTEVAPEVRSDLLERHTKVARVLSSGDTKVEHPGATPQSDLPRIVSRLKVDSLIDHLPSLVRYLITQGLIPMPMCSLFP